MSRKNIQLVIKDLMYMFNRLTISEKSAPAHIPQVTKEVINEPNDVVVIYLDNVKIFGKESEKFWQVAIQLMGKLIAAGFMINIKKYDFLYKEIKMLGFRMGKGTV